MSVARAGISLAIGLLLVGVSYCAGEREGRTSLLLEQNAAAMKANDVQVAKAAEVVDTASKRTAVEKSGRDSAIAERVPVAKRVAVVSDSQVSIDGATPVLVPPLVIQLIGLDTKVILRDSLMIAAQSVQIVALTHQVELLTEAVRLRDERLKLVEPGRCGMKCGVAIGAAGVLAILVGVASLIP